jgi:uncharacterized membrane protein YhaH (DUF805 family)
MINPYRAPGADLSHAGEGGETYQPRFFSANGRIGRARYLGYLMGAWALVTLTAIPLALLVMLLVKNNQRVAVFLPLLLSMAIMGLSFVLAKRRLNDMNKSGWFALLLLIPFVNLALGLWLLFGPGDKGENLYGPAPCGNSTGVVVACYGGLAALVLIVGFTSLFNKLSNAGLSGNAPMHVTP